MGEQGPQQSSHDTIISEGGVYRSYPGEKRFSPPTWPGNEAKYVIQSVCVVRGQSRSQWLPITILQVLQQWKRVRRQVWTVFRLCWCCTIPLWSCWPETLWMLHRSSPCQQRQVAAMQVAIKQRLFFQCDILRTNASTVEWSCPVLFSGSVFEMAGLIINNVQEIASRDGGWEVNERAYSC